jgi:hypothetical protein
LILFQLDPNGILFQLDDLLEHVHVLVAGALRQERLVVLFQDLVELEVAQGLQDGTGCDLVGFVRDLLG